VNALVVSYYRSPEFRGLKASTQGVRRNILDRSVDELRALHPCGPPIGLMFFDNEDEEEPFDAA
jgi:hypothetical protein